MIPRLIHQTAKTAELSDEARRYQQIVRDLHPDWTYKLWTDADNDAFVRSEFPDFHPVFVGLPKNIMRADVIRYLLMDRLGGLYLDLDYEMLRPFDLFDRDCVIPWESDPEQGAAHHLLGNCFFAAAPGHPFFRAVIDSLQAHPPSADASVLETTGPGFITRVFRSLTPELQQTVHTPTRRYFHPPTPRNNREYQAIRRDAEVYGIHHCHGSWREYGLAERLKVWASHIYHKLR